MKILYNCTLTAAMNTMQYNLLFAYTTILAQQPYFLIFFLFTF